MAAYCRLRREAEQLECDSASNFLDVPGEPHSGTDRRRRERLRALQLVVANDCPREAVSIRVTRTRARFIL